MANQRFPLAALVVSVTLLPAVEALTKLSRMSCDVAVYPSIFIEVTPAIRVITSSSEKRERLFTERTSRRGFAREESSSSFSSLQLLEGEQPLLRTALRSSRRLRTLPSDSDLDAACAGSAGPAAPYR